MEETEGVSQEDQSVIEGAALQNVLRQEVHKVLFARGQDDTDLAEAIADGLCTRIASAKIPA